MTAALFKKTALSLAAAATLGAAGTAGAVTNYVANGSFESGLTGWTIGGSDSQGFPPVAIYYNSATAYPTGAFGEAVPPNNAPTNSPDPVGERAAYFVSDFANNQSLSQSVFLTAGTYQLGFSAYLPQNGLNNAGNATFQGVIASVMLANTVINQFSIGQVWNTYTGSTTIAADGNYQVDFIFNTDLYPSKDVVIDQVYIIQGNPPLGEVPEPSTYALMLAGLIALGFIARRRMS